MDSSPDLSLKLRRGSSDSRDTFYMDFAQGIDSDIEEVDNSGNNREPQQPPTPPPSANDDALLAMLSIDVIPTPIQIADKMLTPLNESEELPPTPPLHQSSNSFSSPPVSPTSSVLEMIPPPPLSPPLPLETEVADVVEKTKEQCDEEQKDDDEGTASPPPALEPLPNDFSYVNSAVSSMTPPLTRTPSTSNTPPLPGSPCPVLLFRKNVSIPCNDVSYEHPQPLIPTHILSELSDGHISPTPAVGYLEHQDEVIIPELPNESLNRCEDVSPNLEKLVDEDDSTSIVQTENNGSAMPTHLVEPFPEIESEVNLDILNIPSALDKEEKEMIYENSLYKQDLIIELPAVDETEGQVIAITNTNIANEGTVIKSSRSSPTSSIVLNKQSYITTVNTSHSSSCSDSDSRVSSIPDRAELEEIAKTTNASSESSIISENLKKEEPLQEAVCPVSSLKSLSSSVDLEKCPAIDSKCSSPVPERMQSPSKSVNSQIVESPSSTTQSATSLVSSHKSNISPQKTSTGQIIFNGQIKINEPNKSKSSNADEVNAATPIIKPGLVTNSAVGNTVSFQDEPVMRPHLSSHHHYHLPHQFQHPHHQNHHTHSVPVPTPTVPASYTLSHASNETNVWQKSSPSATKKLQEKYADLENEPQITVLQSRLSTRSRESSHHRVTIDESNLQMSNSSMNRFGGESGSSGPPSLTNSTNQELAIPNAETQSSHLAIMYNSSHTNNFPVLPAIKRHRPSFIYPPMPRVKAGDALATLLSALYGKILVVMGIAFPMAEVISTYIPPSFYEVYYLYLYIGSMIFLMFMYATLLWGKPKLTQSIPSPIKSTIKHRSTSSSDSLNETDTDSTAKRNKRIPSIITTARRPSLLLPLGRQHHYGSFYLRMGAVAFGIGSMIYSGLEFGQYFELNPDTKCHNVLLALTPATRMAFIFIQMYFIFLNNEQIKVYRYKIIARFGLMHMIGTNLAVWLNVLIQETKHEILTFYNPENRTLRISHRIPGHSRGHSVGTDYSTHLRVTRGLKGPYQIFECRRTNIIGTLVQDASPFLFPCTIEYSLICAAILYVMWRSISRPNTAQPPRPDTISSPIKRSPHHYSVDCARAHKGLFVGILILVLTIISLILFFVLISRPDFVSLAVTEVTICELLIYGTATIATLIGMIQVRHLQYDAYRSFSLDDILLVGAQTGSFLYNIFTVIAGHFTIRSDDMLVPINALASIVQTACQTMFILDASRRQAVTPEHIRKKPGREIVTFMLVVNLAMWAISTLEKSRAESHPIQLNFYGLWAWTIITHVSMPLAIFYRFHSTVCLCEIWKRAYKLKPAYM